MVEDADLAQVAWIEANRHLFSDVSGQREREVTEALEVNAVSAYLAGTHLLDEERSSCSSDSGILGRIRLPPTDRKGEDVPLRWNVDDRSRAKTDGIVP